ncbi:phosphodiesterase, MJ0936 family [Coriobacterium glomerans PW2]|uniref:Phosphoesterase n=1 Tax=Coriobacterium glomerans (strain ATCC 49209 / DSM 20642 / JCM 10262 / PW2) TaxID=700015 RepID=F2N947_CORGP|nr:YfcE family phosphodiesterase [Coriobacterium glomerans]AEB07723.1 phosphodiesterase, MJ0936 family [Coriobacterium glomerans PW2]
MKRIDIISDTHGHLSSDLLSALAGADLVVHAGDITSERDWELLSARFEIRAVMGNNDYCRDYGPQVKKVTRFTFEGLRFVVAHYREDLPLESADVAICGHTHRPSIARSGGCLLINPGSPTYPRGTSGPTMARMLVGDAKVVSAKIVTL